MWALALFTAANLARTASTFRACARICSASAPNPVRPSGQRHRPRQSPSPIGIAASTMWIRAPQLPPHPFSNPPRGLGLRPHRLRDDLLRLSGQLTPSLPDRIQDRPGHHLRRHPLDTRTQPQIHQPTQWNPPSPQPNRCRRPTVARSPWNTITHNLRIRSELVDPALPCRQVFQRTTRIQQTASSRDTHRQTLPDPVTHRNYHRQTQVTELRATKPRP